MKKKIFHISLTIITIVSLTRCSDDILDQVPLSEVSIGSYFTSARHFEIYVNKFYETLGSNTWFSPGIFVEDFGSDNQIGENPEPHLNGQTIIEPTDDEWETAYQTIRQINIMLYEGVNNLPDSEYDNAKSYIAEGRFFRAWIYFKLLKRFGAVPWLEKPVYPNDEEALRTPRTPRNQLVESIVADLDFAYSSLKTISESNGRISKEAALAFKSRVCLYEGTWEKYHNIENDPFRIDGEDGSDFIRQAAESASILINSNNFGLYNETDEPYFNLFNREDHSTNPEVILYRHYERAYEMFQSVSWSIFNAADERNGSYGLTRDLVQAYIDIEGNPVSISRLPLSEESIPEVFVNRDPRLKQTLYFPGCLVYYDISTDVTLYYPDLPLLNDCPTGYHSRKGASQDGANFMVKQDQTDLIYIRYGEVLLNYIEAKAELGEVTQEDLDITVNALRARAGFSTEGHLKLGSIPVDNMNVFAQKGLDPLLVEIRRERRVEFAIEGIRIDDIKRWAAADELLMDRTFYGAKYQWWVDNDTQGLYGASKYPTNGDGYLDPWQGIKIGFKNTRDYLYPLPAQEISLAGYQQNPGWE